MDEIIYDLDNIRIDIHLLLVAVKSQMNISVSSAADSKVIAHWETFNTIRSKLISISPSKFSELREQQAPHPTKSSIHDYPVYYPENFKLLMQEIVRAELYLDSYVKGKSAVKIDILEILEHLSARFQRVVRQLRDRHGDRAPLTIEDEYDFQYLLHALLILYFDDIRREEWTPSYAGSSSRVDFLLKNEKTIIELKKTRENLKAKEVGEQLIIDIAKYKTHPDCRTLFCFVYDPEARIANPTSIETDLSKNENNFQVIVRIRPNN